MNCYNLDEKQNEGGYRVSDSALIISQRKADQRVGTKKNLKYFKFGIFSPEHFEALTRKSIAYTQQSTEPTQCPTDLA